MHRIVLAVVIAVAMLASSQPAAAGWKTRALVVVGGVATKKLAPKALEACLRSPKCSTWAASVGAGAVKLAISKMGAESFIECLASTDCAFGDEPMAGDISEYIPAPKDLPGFPGAEEVKRKTPMPGGGLRKRWALPDGRIAEWDYQHGEVELYDKRGKHICAADPQTGKCVKPAVKGRRIEK